MIDTDTSSYAIGRNGAQLADRYRTHAHEIAISAITRFELLRGLAREPGAKNLAAKVHAYLGRITVLPFDEAAITRAAQLDGELYLAGTPIGALDTLIAGHALSVNATVVTSNTRHFGRVTGLTVENWID